VKKIFHIMQQEDVKMENAEPKKIINAKNKKVHYIADAHHTLCGMSDEGVEGYAKPVWTPTTLEVNCKLCLKRMPKK